MFTATPNDVGRRVEYQPYPSATVERGTITSVNERFVFVRYDSQRSDAGGQATDPTDLAWEAVSCQ